MVNEKSHDIQDVLNLFEDTLSASDVLTSKLIAQFTTAIVKERLKLHMNQTEFAKHIGVSQSQVSQWEKGDYNFSLRKIAEIASALNLEMNLTVTDSRISKSSQKVTPCSNSLFTKTIVYSAAESSFMTASSSHQRPEISVRNLSKEDQTHASIRE